MVSIHHIWLWDKYSHYLMFPLMREGSVLSFIDQTAMNSNAESFAKTLKSKEDLIDVFKETRTSLIQESNEILRVNVKFYVGKREHTIESYVEKFIIRHDKHHIGQIDRFIRKTTA